MGAAIAFLGENLTFYGKNAKTTLHVEIFCIYMLKLQIFS